MNSAADGSRAVSVATGGVEAAADGSVVGGNGLMGGNSNRSGGEMGPFFYFKTVNVGDGWGMELGGGVTGGLIVRCCFGDEGLGGEGPGCGGDLHSWSSRLLKSSSCSKFSRPGLKHLTLVGMGCLGRVFGKCLDFGEVAVFLAYVCEGVNC